MTHFPRAMHVCTTGYQLLMISKGVKPEFYLVNLEQGVQGLSDGLLARGAELDRVRVRAGGWNNKKEQAVGTPARGWNPDRCGL
jgi:hypothetical protein